ncbi:Mg2+ transporter-E [Heterobasidion irregulare TC 32-1]|uniref:Mg2+ transporter-E n=1 Tax=Heterobasidion irregulare (strain TC 32-1) TaxID=747525 RepID=W4KJ97_HETIT|nr:Mg2+ transporter-E [Heterobasidion irregulare TC 32-1]ETW85141.1 Mg2+ transporter-E [Heterobasidion irregulare TC 32-1]
MHSDSASSSDDDDIEMTHLEDITVTPNPRLFDRTHYPPVEVEDHASEDGDEGEMALLGSGGNTRWRDESTTVGKGLWAQTGSIVVETAPTLLFTTIGLMFTGELLDHVSRWKAMSRINELIMIIPVVLNLKGNLEMNLSARLGTAANMGDLDSAKTRNAIVWGNLTLLQVQAAVVSFVAALVSIVLGLIVPPGPPPPPPPEPGSADETLFSRRFLYNVRTPYPARPLGDPRPKSGFSEIVMVASTAMSATCLSAIVLGSFMCGLIVICRKFGRDPDNIAPPVASCLGDLVTLFLLGVTSTILIRFLGTPVPFGVIVLIVCTSVGCAVLTRRNPHVKDLLLQGWSPLLGAMIISSGTGIILDMFVSRYEGFALLAVAISGLPGSVGSVLVSRLSTSLHASVAGSLPTTSASSFARKPPRTEPSPRLVMLTLFFVTLPVEVIFLAVLRALNWLRLPFPFVAASVFFFCFAVFISLVVARYLTDFLWSRGFDPDMYALPVHSALMDLVGQLLLVACFELVSVMGISVGSKP